MSGASGKGKSDTTCLVCATCGADMVCLDHGLSLPCEMCDAEGVTPSPLCSRCGGTVARTVNEAERQELLEKETNPQAGKFRALLKSADGGDVAAQYSVAMMYWSGDGVGQDEADAVKWFRTAAEHGHAESQLWLGRAYLKGEGVRKNAPDAVKWYRKAANNKVLAAQYELAMLLYEGQGSVDQDLNGAKHWMTEAANGGFAGAQYQLGLHSNGDYAKYWLQQAAAQGHKEAKEALTELLISEGHDPLYDAAVEFVVKSGRASISLVQRELRIGYNRAARLVEMMEQHGIVSPMQSSGNREVLVGLDGKPKKHGDAEEDGTEKSNSTNDELPWWVAPLSIWFGLSFIAGFLVGAKFWFASLIVAVLLFLFLLRKLHGIDRFVGAVVGGVALPGLLFALVWTANFTLSDFKSENVGDTKVVERVEADHQTAAEQKTPQDNTPQPDTVSVQDNTPQPDTVSVDIADEPVAQGTTPQTITWPKDSFPGDAPVVKNNVDRTPKEASSEIDQALVVQEAVGRGDSDSVTAVNRSNVKPSVNESGAHGWLGLAASPEKLYIAPPITLPGNLFPTTRNRNTDYSQRGMIITNIAQGGPAEKTGLVVGDLLVSIDDKVVDTVNAIQDVMLNIPIGRVVPIKIIRDGREKHLLMTIEQRP